MVLPEQKQEFARLFYGWALQDWQRERSHGYPHLRTLKTGIVPIWIDILEHLPPPERDALITALVKYYHQEGAHASGDPIRAEEFQMFRQYRDECLTKSRLDWNNPAYQEYKKGVRRLNRQRFRKMVRRRVSEALGREHEKWPGAVFRCTTYFGEWKVLTSISYGNHHDLSYYHRIHLGQELRDSDYGENVLLGRTSLLHWLGLTHQTWWSFLSEDDAELVSDCVASLCVHFVEAAKEMLNDTT